MKDIMVSKSDKGEISVFDQRDDFVACFRDGNWFNKLIFQAYEEEEFTIIDDDQEALALLEEARSALGKPLSKSRPL